MIAWVKMVPSHSGCPGNVAVEWLSLFEAVDAAGYA